MEIRSRFLQPVLFSPSVGICIIASKLEQIGEDVYASANQKTDLAYWNQIKISQTSFAPSIGRNFHIRLQLQSYRDFKEANFYARQMTDNVPWANRPWHNLICVNHNELDYQISKNNSIMTLRVGSVATLLYFILSSSWNYNYYPCTCTSYELHNLLQFSHVSFIYKQNAEIYQYDFLDIHNIEMLIFDQFEKCQVLKGSKGFTMSFQCSSRIGL